VVCAGLLLAAAAGLRAQTTPSLTEEFHQSYPLAAGGRVSLSNVNGGVRVTAWDRDEVRVDAVKRAATQELLREAEIKVEAGAGSVSIHTEYPERQWHDREGERRERIASVEYTLSVPRGARLEGVSVVNGPLHVEGLSGAVNASSVNGHVTARALSGPVKLSAVNGAVDVTLDRLAENASYNLSVVKGSLSVTIPSDANAHLRASTVQGTIANDFNLPVRVGEYVGRDLEGRLGTGGASVRLSSVQGAINIRRAADNRTPSPVTNLLSEASRGDFKRKAREDTAESENGGALDAGELERVARDAAREAARAARDAERVGRDAERELRKAEKELNKELNKGVFKQGVADAHRQIERESNSFNVSGSPRVRVETFDGPVTVHAWDKPEVMYTAVKRAEGEHEMKGIKVLAQGAGQEVTIRAEFDKTFARQYEERAGRVVTFSSGASTEFDVYVPRDASVTVSSGDGRVRVEGVMGELELRTGDGPIDVSGGRRRLRADTGDGRINIEGFEGEADARTGDGRISLEGRFQKLSARTGEGTISLALPEGVNANLETEGETVVNDGVATAADQSEGRVRRWVIGGGGQLLSLRTGEGQIILRRR
jgi:DUF4097 and DUF4098 domain-containing protein YvlB